MLGSFAVGKSSLTRRYISNAFSDVYRTTLGVKIDKKVIGSGPDQMAMIVWDVQGDDHEQRIVPGYLRGMAGYLLVVDPTRPRTLETAFELHHRVESLAGELPWVLALNKSDLSSSWIADVGAMETLGSTSIATVETSAKTGAGVDECFAALGSAFQPQPARWA